VVGPLRPLAPNPLHVVYLPGLALTSTSGRSPIAAYFSRKGVALVLTLSPKSLLASCLAVVLGLACMGCGSSGWRVTATLEYAVQESSHGTGSPS